jgi:hypothetical protein
MLKYTALIFISFSIIFTSCEKQDDYSKLTANYRYQASFSLPVGDSSLNIENNGKNLPPDWQIDTILANLDTIFLQQEITFNVANSLKDVNYIRSLFLVVAATNEFPAGAHLRLYFADSSDVIVDSISDERNIPPANVDSLGKVLTTGYTIIPIEVFKDHYNKWSNVQNIIVTGFIFRTTKYRHLYKYYKNYKLKIEMGFRVDFDHTFYKKVL